MTKFEILVARQDIAQDQCLAAEQSGDKVKHLKALIAWGDITLQVYHEAIRVNPAHPKIPSLLPAGWRLEDFDHTNRKGKIASLVRQYVRAGVCNGSEFPGINWR